MVFSNRKTNSFLFAKGAMVTEVKFMMYYARREELTFKRMNKLNGVWREKGWSDWKWYGKNRKNRKIGKLK